MKKHLVALAASAVAMAVSPVVSSAAVTAFSDNFDTDTATSWNVNKHSADNFADFAWDYGTLAGIPAAPNSGGTTKGLRLRSNISSNVFTGLSVSPLAQNFTGDYTLKFDMWLNYNGPLGTGASNVAGGNGSTHAFSSGVGVTGTSHQMPGASASGITFAQTVDGGSAQDYRIYHGLNAQNGDATTELAASGAGNRNDSHAYYAGVGEKTAPAAQVTLFPGQTGTTRTGVMAFAWREVVVDKVGNIVTWTIDGKLLATADVSGDTMSNNIHLGYFDTNGTSSTDPNAANTLFGLVDNVRVEAVPEPTSLAALGLAGLGLMARRRRSA